MGFEQRRVGAPRFENLDATETDGTPPRRTGRGRWLLPALGVLAAGLAVVALVPSESPPPMPPRVALPEPAPMLDPPVPLPPRAESDGRLAELLGALSTRAEWRAWLSQDDLLTRFVAAVDNLAEGKSPRAHVPFLAPNQPFLAVERGGREYVDPASWARWNAATAVVESVDPKTLARVYRTLAPLADAAYRAFGYPERRFDDVLGRALDRIVGVPVPAGEIELVAKGAIWAYADPRLEALAPGDKQLLRLGPDNLARVQSRARALREALRTPEL